MTLQQYKSQYEEAMRAQGITVTWAEDGGSPYGVDAGVFTTPENWVATLSRDGVSTTTLVSAGRVQLTGMSAEELANQDATFALRRTGQLDSPQGQLPSSWFNPSPGLPPTVPAGNNTSQPAQAPPPPNLGTITPPPAAAPPVAVKQADKQYTFWEWNYFQEQATGRPGPAPEDVGVPNGNQLMTRAQWVAAVGNWYGAPVAAPPPTTPSAGGGVGGTPTTPSIPVGGTGTTPTAPPPAAPPVGGTPTAPPAPSSGPELRSFWEWNALKEQSSGVPGDDPFNYGIAGDTKMSFEEWKALTLAYYTGNGNPANPPGPSKDDASLILGAALALGYLAARIF